MNEGGQVKDFELKPADIFNVVRRRRLPILITFFVTYLSVMGIFFFIPRAYQSEAVLVIGVSYFQNPLIGDLISQTHDPGELRTEREKIIKASLGVDFAEKMGEKYNLFRTAKGDPSRAIEIEWFLKALAVNPVSAAQFQIKYRGGSPEVADGVIRGAIEAIRAYMFASRVRMLEEFSGVLGDEIQNTSDASSKPMVDKSGAPRSDAMKTQLSSQITQLEKRLDELHRRYNEQHPSVQAARAELEELREYERSGGLSPRLTRRKIFRTGTAAGLPMTTIKDDLSKQKHLVNISLEMERKDPSMSSYLSLTKEPVFPKNPVFPKIRLFLLFGLVMSVMFSTFAAALLEFWQRIDIPTSTLTRRLGIEMLGTLHLRKEKRD